MGRGVGRAGARVKRFFADVWLRNAFDASYVPIAIPYPGFAPSGFIGENGRPHYLTLGAGRNTQDAEHLAGPHVRPSHQDEAAVRGPRAGETSIPASE